MRRLIETLGNLDHRQSFEVSHFDGQALIGRQCRQSGLEGRDGFPPGNRTRGCVIVLAESLEKSGERVRETSCPALDVLSMAGGSKEVGKPMLCDRGQPSIERVWAGRLESLYLSKRAKEGVLHHIFDRDLPGGSQFSLDPGGKAIVLGEQQPLQG
jgi:hypothetical protein